MVSFVFFPLLGWNSPKRARTSSWSRLHDHKPHPVGLLWTSAQPDAEISTSQNSQEIDIYAPGGIRTRSPNKRAASDQRRRRRNQWVRPFYSLPFQDTCLSQPRGVLQWPSRLAHYPLPPRHQQVQLPNFILCHATGTVSHYSNTSPSSDDDILL